MYVGKFLPLMFCSISIYAAQQAPISKDQEYAQWKEIFLQVTSIQELASKIKVRFDWGLMYAAEKNDMEIIKRFCDFLAADLKNPDISSEVSLDEQEKARVVHELEKGFATGYDFIDLVVKYIKTGPGDMKSFLCLLIEDTCYGLFKRALKAVLDAPMLAKRLNAYELEEVFKLVLKLQDEGLLKLFLGSYLVRYLWHKSDLVHMSDNYEWARGKEIINEMVDEF